MVVPSACDMPTPFNANVPVPTETVPTLIAPDVLTDTLFAPLFDNAIAPVKLLLAFANVMAFAPAVKLDVLDAVSAPLCVMAPAVVTSNVPDIVDAPKINAPASTIFTLLPDVIATVEKSLVEVSKVILFADPAASVATPVTANAPLSVMAPAVVTSNVPLMVEAANSKALASFNVTLLPVVIPTLEKVFAASSVILFVDPAASVVAPVTANTPLSVIAPLAVTDKSEEIVDAPKSIALVSTNVTLLPDVIATVAKAFDAWSNVILLLDPTANVVVPLTPTAPLSVSAPASVTPNVPVMVDVVKSKPSSSRNKVLVAAVTPTVSKSLPELSKVNVLPPLTVSVAASTVVLVFCEIAPLKLSPPESPRITVPDVAAMVPNAAVVPSKILSAVVELLVVVIDPEFICKAPSFKSILIVPVPDAIALLAASVTPTLDKVILPLLPLLSNPSSKVSDPPAPDVVKVIPPGAVMPFTVPLSSAKLPTVSARVDVLVRFMLPADLDAATVFSLLLELVSVTLPPPRKIKLDVLVLKSTA